MKDKFLNLLLISLSFLFIFNSCKDKNKQKNKPKVGFINYITGYTSGIISNSDDILIEISEKHDVKKGDEIKKKLFEFNPNIKGKTYWKDPFTIVFHPENRLPNGKIFKAVFHLDKVIDVPSDFKKFDFNFQTKTQDFDISFQGMQAYNSKKLEINKLSGKITTSDFTDNQDVEKILSAIQNGKNKPINWTHNEGFKEHSFTIDSIIRNDNKGNVLVKWDGNPIGVERKDSKDITIPSLSDFSLMDYEIISQPDQKIILHFSDPVSKKQNLRGLIHFVKPVKITTYIDGNSIKIYPKNRLKGTHTLIIERGVKNSLGHRLNQKYNKKFIFSSLKPNIKTIGKGVIMPDDNGLKFPFMAVNLKAVNVKILKIFQKNIGQFLQVNNFDGKREIARVGRIIYNKEVPLISSKSIDYGKWNTFALDLSKMIKTEPGAIYRVIMSFNRSQSLYNCPVGTSEPEKVETKIDNSSYDGPGSYYDYYEDDYYYDYDYRQRENPCSDSYYHRNDKKIKRNILASNFGIIVKEDSDHTLNIAVSDLISANKISGVSIKIYNYQNKLMGKTATNSDGMASIKLDGKAFLLIAEKNKRYGYLRLDDGSSLSLSMFNVSGNKIKKGLKGYIYGERGVWRPGDSIYLNFVLEDKQNNLPEHHPVVMEIFTPQNQLFERKTKNSSVNNFYDFRFATPQDAETGNWTARIKVGNSVFSKSLRIETVKPNRLKINLKFDTDVLHASSKPIKLEAKWLHGATASNLKAIVDMRASRAKTAFKDYPDYHFDDPSKDFYSEEKTIFDGKLNSAGTATIPLKINYKDTPGMIKLSFKTRVFENGGDFSIDRTSKKYSPYKTYVGLKIPEGKAWNNALFSDDPILIPVASVDEFGNPISRKKLKVEVYEISWRWWWERNSNEDLGYYITSSNSKKIITDYVSTRNGKAIYKLKFPETTWGRKFIKITDPVSGHSSGKIFYTTYKGWWDNPDNVAPGGAEMLSFSTDKKSYKPGETVKISLPVSKEGRALISVENGSDMLLSFWTNVSKNNHSAEFRVTKEMSPNVYIHISYIQPHKQTENDRPIRLYGVQYVKIENPNSHLHPEIVMKEELRPENNFKIKVKEKDGKPMTYTLAVVDEGLLDLTKFKTPNPWNSFYAREALGVKTYDMYSYVMGAFTGKLAGLLAVGGDEDLQETGNKKANRFKPVVQFIGPFYLKKGKTNTHKLSMPNYVGSVRVMVVAGDVTNSSYGNAEKAVPVKKPLMVLTGLPRVLGPNEKVKLPVSVFVMDNKIKNVKVKVQTNDLITVNGDNTKSIEFSKEGDQIVNFDLNVVRKVGIAKIKVTVEGGGEHSYDETELQVRIANPELTHIKDGVADANATWTTEYSPIGIIGTNKAVLEVSSIPPINLEKRLNYLIQYPHGCIEQTTSSVFPQLYLNDLMDLSNVKKAEIQNNIEAGLERLKKFQLINGGFTYWPGESGYASDWGTNYAGHFMLEAKQKGYALPPDMLKNWISYQKKRANDWSNNTSSNYASRSTQITQAYRLYTLALAGKAQLGAMNRLREVNNLQPIAKWRLAATYYLAGKTGVAKELINNLSTKTDDYTELYYTYGSGLRDKAMILETLILMNKKSLAKQLLDEIASNLSSDNWYSTQTTSYSLLAISKFVTHNSTKGDMKFKVTYPNGEENIKTSKTFAQIPLNFSNSGMSKLNFENQSGKTLFIRLINQGIPLESNDLKFEKNLEMKVKYFDINGIPIDPGNIKQGTDFVIEVNIKHPGILKNYQNMALTQIFPSGWEITNPRMDNIQKWKSDTSTYQDVRDDRVLTYFNLNKYKTKTFRIMANASYVGEYYLPSIKCEAMYDNNIISITNGRWVRNVK